MLLGIGVRSPTSNASASPFRLRGAYLTGAFCVTATGAWYLLRTMYHAEAKVMLAMGLGLAAVLVPVQLFFGHLNGRYVGKHQPSKMAAIEARWNDEKPASEVLIASMSCNRSIMPARAWKSAARSGAVDGLSSMLGLKCRIQRSILAGVTKRAQHACYKRLMHDIVEVFPIRRASGRSCKHVSQRAKGLPVPGSPI